MREISIPKRRFGRTGIMIPLLSLGGMRFQQSWEDLESNKIEKNNQKNLENTLNRAFSFGLNHIETARHYGSSERQIGYAFQKIGLSNSILQTKVPPCENVLDFECQLETSFDRLKSNKVDLLSIHGINLPEHLYQTLRPGGCLEVLKRWQKKGRIGNIGFSTHGSTDLIIQALESNAFDYVNLHWYYIKQDNHTALSCARKNDLGVFIISPTDKGGHLHSPSKKLLELCDPLHPIVFNDLFCLRDPRVHTISIGLAQPSDLDFHLDAVNLLNQADELVSNVKLKLEESALNALGNEWLSSWELGLPTWENTPGNINIPILLWLHNLIEAWDLESYAKARYALLGNAGHWFPGENADLLDTKITNESLKIALRNSPWVDQIPGILRSLKDRFGGKPQKRLWS